jgi:signal transduction histidine kinase
MRTPIRSRWPVSEVIMLVMVGLIGWAAWRSWEVVLQFEDSRRLDRGQQVRELARQRTELSRLLELYAVRDDYFAFEKNAQPPLQEMRAALRRFVQANDNKDWKTFDWSRHALQRWIERTEQRVRNRNITALKAWMQRPPMVATNTAEVASLDVGRLLQAFRQTYTEYVASASFIEQTLNALPPRQPPVNLPRRVEVTPPRDPDVVRRREVVDERMDIAEVQSLQLLDIVDQAHREGTAAQWFIELQAMAQPLAAANTGASLQSFQGQFMPVLYTLSAGLVGLCIASGLSIYRRFVVAPLHLKLVERETIMEQQKKFAHFEKLAAVLAHEIKQPLSAINVWVWTLQKTLAEGTAEHKGATVIRNELNRVDQIVKDFLKLTQPVAPKLVTMQSEPFLREILDLLRPKLERNSIRLRIDTTVDTPFLGDPQQLKQVLLNLVQNAAESIGEKGDVVLRSRRDTMELRDERTDVVVIEVQDSGPGIPAEVQERLFDPFFSTKENGAGLGLAIAARIVDKHEGALVFETQQDHGTTFGIVLPVKK